MDINGQGRLWRRCVTHRPNQR